MDNVIDRIPVEFRDLFVEILAGRNPELLAAMRNQDKPTPEQQELVDDIFTTEIIQSMDDSYTPTEKGKRAERTIEEFWQLWPRSSTDS